MKTDNAEFVPGVRTYSISTSSSLYLQISKCIKKLLEKTRDLFASILFSVYTRHTSEWQKIEKEYHINIEHCYNHIISILRPQSTINYHETLPKGVEFISFPAPNNRGYEVAKIDFERYRLFKTLQQAKKEYKSYGLDRLDSIQNEKYDEYTAPFFEIIRRMK